MKKLDSIEAIKSLTVEEIKILAKDCYDVDYNSHKEDLSAEYTGCVQGMLHLIGIIKKNIPDGKIIF